MTQTLADATEKARVNPASHAIVQGFSLPAMLYNSPESFAEDNRHIIARAWHLVDHVSMFSEPGRFVTREIGGESLITVRGNDQTLRTFHNVCRHRGSRICAGSEGTSKRLICPYHAWTYDLTGGLIAAPGLPEGISRDSLSLKPVRTTVFNGLVLATFDTLIDTECLSGLTSFIADSDLAATRVAARRRFDVDANWKLVFENFVECYHCYGTHPEYMAVNAPDMVSITRGKAGILDALKSSRAAAGSPKVLQGADQLFAFQRPLREGYRTGSRSGKQVAPLLGKRRDFDGLATVIAINPFVWISIYNDYAVLFRFAPRAPLRTEVEAIWLVKETALEGVDYQLDDLLWLWEATLAQDKDLVRNNQLGVLSAAYQPGPYCADEQMNVTYSQWYLERIGLTQIANRA